MHDIYRCRELCRIATRRARGLASLFGHPRAHVLRGTPIDRPRFGKSTSRRWEPYITNSIWRSTMERAENLHACMSPRVETRGRERMDSSRVGFIHFAGYVPIDNACNSMPKRVKNIFTILSWRLRRSLHALHMKRAGPPRSSDMA